MKPTTTQEEQQAQTIADARKWAAEESAWLSRQELPQSESVEHMDGVLQIVDSQAQKIAEHAKEIERLKKIEKAARDVLYYQGSEGSAELLESALEETP